MNTYVVALRREHAKAIVQGSVFISCIRCENMCVVLPEGQKMIGIGYDLLCNVCMPEDVEAGVTIETMNEISRILKRPITLDEILVVLRNPKY